MTVLNNFAVFSFLVAGTTKAALFKPLEMNKWGDSAKKVDPVEIVNILVDGEKKGAISMLEAKMFADDSWCAVDDDAVVRRWPAPRGDRDLGGAHHARQPWCRLVDEQIRLHGAGFGGGGPAVA